MTWLSYRFVSRGWIVVALGLLFVPRCVFGDYLEVLRAATIKNAPNRAAPILHRPDVGDILLLVTSEQTDGYYHVQVPGQTTTGWIYRTLVRRHAGLPTAAPDVAVLRELTAPAIDRPLTDEERSNARRHLALGKPQSIHERYREGYSAAVDTRLRIPIWVQYQLTREELDGPGDRARSRFRADDSLPRLASAALEDYRGSGYDRGHLAPAADMKRSQKVMDESHLLSNIAPQVGIGFNRHIWADLENAIRAWTRQRGELTIIVGPIFLPQNTDGTLLVTYRVIGENLVAVPTAFFKIVAHRTESGPADVLAFVIPNTKLSGRHYSEFLVSIDSIEAVTGLDFLAALPDDEEEIVESRVASQAWPLIAPNHGNDE